MAFTSFGETMRIGFIADLHLGNHRKLGGSVRCSLNKRCWDALEVFRRATARAREKECHALFVLGDFFDTARPLPQLYHEAMSIAEDAGIAIYFMRGNHETVSTAQADNSLAPLLHLDPGGLAQDSVIEQPRTVMVGRNTAVICIPYLPEAIRDKEFADWADLFQQGSSNAGRLILALHAGITDSDTEKFLQRKPGTVGVSVLAELCQEFEIGCVVAGHFHQHRLWRQRQDHGMAEIMQLGALCPRDYRDVGLEGYGTLAIWDNGSLSRIEIPGPRFFDYSPIDTPRKGIDFGTWTELLKATRTTGQWLYPRVKVPADELTKYREALLKLKEQHHIAGFDLSPVADGQQAAKEAAEAGQSRRSLSRALAACTEDLPQGLAEKVQRLARQYLGKSRDTHAGCLPLDVEVIRLENLMRHTATELTLPKQGVVVVRGPNDSGKSSLAEAVSAACWGKTMRKTPPWQAGVASLAGLGLSDGTWISRAWQNGKQPDKEPHLDFGADGESNWKTNKPANATVAQAQLECLIGSFELWQRSHVLSSIDALRFSIATDGERKRLAEQVVGIDFDTALAACRADIKAAEKKLTAEKHARETASLKLEGEKRRRDAAQDAVNRLRRRDGKPELNQRQLRQQQEQRNEALRENSAERRRLESEREAVGEELTKIDLEIGKAQAGRQLHSDQLQKLQSNTCPVCKQPIAEQLRLSLLAEAEDLRCIARDHLGSLKAHREHYSQERRKLGDQICKLDEAAREIRATLQAESSASRVAEGEASRQLEIIDAASKLIRAYTRELDDRDDEIFLLERQLKVLKEVERVLGLKGARALVLADVFTSIAEAARHALSQMPADIELEVSASKVLVNGKDYRASGHGVRKKADLAMAVALAEVTSAASGRKPGTLWLDEIDDGLDSGEGISQVAQLIQELARDRCVVVITHNDLLAEELEAAERWDVCDGKVEVSYG